MTEVTLLEMLDARERRAQKQQDLLQKFGSTLICFTMNIAGPIKISDAIIRAFREGCSKIRYRIPEDRMTHQELIEEKTGCEAYFVVNDDAIKVKEICASIEDETELGRLFDIDVIDSRGEKLDRNCVNGKSRDCIVCGATGRGCASRRLHTVAELQSATNQIIYNHFAKMDSEQIGGFAVQSLLEEVHTTPKPGLVDCNDSGSHKDMDLYTVSTLQLYSGLEDVYVMLDARSKRAYFGDVCKGALKECSIRTLDEIALLKDKKIVGDVELIGLENSEIDFVSNFVKLEPYYVKVENKHTLVPEYLKEESAYLVK